MRHLGGSAVALATVFVLTGCYSYVPLEGPAPVGSEVRAHLTNETALKESELTGVLTQDYSGRVMAITSDSLMLSVIAARAIGAAQTRTARRIVGLPMTGVEGLEERKLSGIRTALAVAGGGAAVAAIVGGILTVGGNSGGDDGGGGDTAFRFFWPF